MMPRSALNSASVKNTRPANITPTKRLLFDSDDTASIVTDVVITRISEYSVIAGNR